MCGRTDENVSEIDRAIETPQEAAAELECWLLLIVSSQPLANIDGCYARYERNKKGYNYVHLPPSFPLPV